MRAFLPHMRQHGEPGHIVNTSSMSGLTPKALAGPYGATKFALVGLSHVLHDELADTNIGVSVLCPGWTRPTCRTTAAIARRGSAGRSTSAPTRCWPSATRLCRGLAAGLDPLDLAALVIRAIEENEFYIVTQPDRRAACRRATTKS